LAQRRRGTGPNSSIAKSLVGSWEASPRIASSQPTRERIDVEACAVGEVLLLGQQIAKRLPRKETVARADPAATAAMRKGNRALRTRGA
jgi:hypothetical protein